MRGRSRVAVLHPSLNYLGGAVRVCLGFVSALYRAGFEVSLFTVDRTDWSLVRRVLGDIGNAQFKEYFIFSRFPGFFNRALKNVFLVLFYVLEVLAVRFLLGFDMVFVVGGELIDCIGDVIYVNAIPFRLTHLFPTVRLGNNVVWKCYSRLYDVFLKILGKMDSRGLLVANSCFLREILLGKLSRDSIVIHPPVDTSRFMVSEDGGRLNLVVIISRLHPGKSLDVALEVAKCIDGARFSIIGLSGRGSRGDLSRLSDAISRLGLQDRVSILVNESASELPEVLSRAKVLLHTQSSEAFGIAVVEAMAAGCVPVVPCGGGPWIDILDQMQGVYGFAYHSIDEAVNIIKTLLNDEVLRRDVANRARVRALHFDKSIFEEKILDLVKKILNKIY